MFADFAHLKIRHITQSSMQGMSCDPFSGRTHAHRTLMSLYLRVALLFFWFSFRPSQRLASQHSVYALSDLVKRIFQFSYFSIRFFMTCSNNHFICYSYINFTTSDHKFFLRSAIKRLKVTQSSSFKKFDQKFGYFQKHSICNTFLLLSVTESCVFEPKHWIIKWRRKHSSRICLQKVDMLL